MSSPLLISGLLDASPTSSHYPPLDPITAIPRRHRGTKAESSGAQTHPDSTIVPSDQLPYLPYFFQPWLSELWYLCRRVVSPYGCWTHPFSPPCLMFVMDDILDL